MRCPGLCCFEAPGQKLLSLWRTAVQQAWVPTRGRRKASFLSEEDIFPQMWDTSFASQMYSFRSGIFNFPSAVPATGWDCSLMMMVMTGENKHCEVTATWSFIQHFSFCTPQAHPCTHLPARFVFWLELEECSASLSPWWLWWDEAGKGERLSSAQSFFLLLHFWV